MRNLYRNCSLLLAAAVVVGPPHCVRAAPQVKNPYREIAVRNAFGLRPIPPPVQNAAIAAPPLPAITLTGITTLLGNKRALLEIGTTSARSQPTSLRFPKPAQPQTSTACILSEGQEQEGVKVLRINVKARSVTVSCAGTITNLTFEKNGRISSPQPVAQPHITVPIRRFPFRTAAR